MAASDPTPYVATPTGTLQGVAAFSWDGSAWQPSGRAGPSVATPTGVLQGVAAFNGGPAWQPAGRAQPGVATPTGVLDGVAVYTWSGSAWTPTGGTATPSTPSGALRGVAAFSWDGSAWQPAAQARPSVATPYGVLDGVAMFNWSGSAWAPGAALPPGVTLDLSFFGPTLDLRITFTRASTATYFDTSGTMQTAASGAPRFDYDPVTHAARGLLIEEARTNVALQSSNFGVSWAVLAVALTGGVAGAPDGTASMTRIAETAVTNIHFLNQSMTLLASTQYVFSVFAKAAENQYLELSLDDGVANGGFAVFDLQAGTVTQGPIARGTGVVGVASMQAIGNGIYRCSVGSTIGAATTGRAFFALCNSATPGFAQSYAGNAANGLLIWGAQLEAGSFPTSHIPTTAAAATRAVDAASMPTAAWFNASTGSLAVEAYAPPVGAIAVINPAWATLDDGTANNVMELRSQTAFADFRLLSFVANVNSGASVSPNTMVANAVFKGAATYSYGPAASLISLNGAAPSASGVSALPAGMTTLRIGPSRGNPPSNAVRRVRYWPRALTNAELQSVTT